MESADHLLVSGDADLLKLLLRFVERPSVRSVNAGTLGLLPHLDHLIASGEEWA